MAHALLAVLIFLWLAAVALAAVSLFPRLPNRHRDEDTTVTIRLVANLFVVMTSLVFGLMVNSARTTFDMVDANVHQYATSLIILDRTLRHEGEAGAEARSQLADYVRLALEQPARGTTTGTAPDPASDALDALGDAIAQMVRDTGVSADDGANARQQYRQIVQQRWAIVEQSEGRIPAVLILMLVAWLTMVFIGYGYKSPRNATAIGFIVSAAALLAASLYLTMDMDVPFSGPMRIEDTPLRRALAEIEQ